MRDQYKKITGYRDLTQEEIDMMNEVKELGASMKLIIQKVCDFNDAQLVTLHPNGDITGNEIAEAIINSDSDEWIVKATMELKTGLMSLTRAVAKPTFF